MTAFFSLFFILIMFLVYAQVTAKEKRIENFKQAISKKGELLRFYLDLKNPGGRNSQDYIAYYRDPEGQLHCCKIHIDYSGHQIREDKIVPDTEQMTGYNIFNKPQPAPEPVITEEKIFSTEDGEMCIQLSSKDIEPGNKVFLNNKPAPDGKYKIGFLHYIYVKEGRVS